MYGTSYGPNMNALPNIDILNVTTRDLFPPKNTPRRLIGSY